MAVAVKVTDRDLGWVEFFKRMQQIHSGRVKVGVLEEGARDEETGLSVSEYGAINEFGTQDGHVPERSYLRSTFDEQREALTEMGRKLMGHVLDGRVTVEQGLNMLGAKLATEVKKKIANGIAPENRPSTKAKKGSSKPLVDTGRLLNAITWAIVGSE